MLEIHDHDAVREIRLARPPANALNGALVAGLTEALKTAADEARAIVVSASGRMFCAGLDVPELMRLDRPAFTALWRDFVGLMKTIATSPVPVAFAMQGHSVGGGLVLALFADCRVMPAGPFKTGLNEVQVGLIAPSPPFRALVRLVGPHRAERLLVSGEILDSKRAHELGLVDELAPTPDDVLPAALAWCEAHLALPAHAMAISRSMARADLHLIFEEYRAEENESYVDLWFEEHTQAMLRELVAKLGK